ncbi:MAG TPA: lipoprotein insertase outer membrane protein LolB [Steroidobacteraceae bacterium]|nr:lipoprotein insertase outer membrane protein LolB [Steroidobacteraceae bacterium]
MRALLAGIVLLSLAACHTLAPVVDAPWSERRAALQSLDHYRFNGQLAAATATDGFSAALRWQQQGAASDVLLRAPLGVGGAHLSYDGALLRVTAADGSQLEGEAAQAELVRLLGFEPPLASLRYWLLGVPDPRQPDAIETLDDTQRLARLQQGSWQIDYGEYMREAERWLPRRVTIGHGPLRLKLRVSNWQLP